MLFRCCVVVVLSCYCFDGMVLFCCSVGLRFVVVV